MLHNYTKDLPLLIDMGREKEEKFEARTSKQVGEASHLPKGKSETTMTLQIRISPNVSVFSCIINFATFATLLQEHTGGAGAIKQHSSVQIAASVIDSL